MSARMKLDSFSILSSSLAPSICHAHEPYENFPFCNWSHQKHKMRWHSPFPISIYTAHSTTEIYLKSTQRRTVCVSPNELCVLGHNGEWEQSDDEKCGNSSEKKNILSTCINELTWRNLVISSGRRTDTKCATVALLIPSEFLYVISMFTPNTHFSRPTVVYSSIVYVLFTCIFTVSPHQAGNLCETIISTKVQRCRM